MAADEVVGFASLSRTGLFRLALRTPETFSTGSLIGECSVQPVCPTVEVSRWGEVHEYNEVALRRQPNQFRIGIFEF